MKNVLLSAVAAIIILGGARAASAAPIKVASLSTVLSDVARKVGGDQVQVIEVVKPGIDPHHFQPSPGDVQKVAGADLVLLSGKGMEGYLAKLEQSTGSKGKFVAVGERIGAALTLKEEDKVVEDPHWWHSVANVKKAVIVVRDAFIAAEPAGRDAFIAAAAAYGKELEALDKEIKLTVAGVPRDQRKLVTTHDAFQYFAHDYGFKIYHIEGISTEAQPSSKEVAALIETIQKEKVKGVFFENIENPKVIAAITQESGAKVGGELYADGLSAADGDAATYPAMMRHNVQIIVNALK